MRVNLLLDQNTPVARVVARETAGRVSVTPRHPVPLWIRLPIWVDRALLRITGTEDYRILGDYVLIAQPEPGKPVSSRVSGAEAGNYPGSPHEKHQGCS